jgi:hypothetical protein
LYGERCEIYMDHKSLKYFFTHKELDMRQTLGPKQIQDTRDKVHVMKEIMSVTQSWQKSYTDNRRRPFVTPPKLASANSMESLAIYPFDPTCDQTGNHPYKTVRVNAREGE